MRFFKLFLIISVCLVGYLLIFHIEYICPRFKNSLGCYSGNLELRLGMFGLDNSRDYLKKIFDEGLITQGQCHTLGHGLGQNAARSGVGMLEAMEDGSSFCGWAFFHGVMEGLFGSGAGHGKISVQNAYDTCAGMIDPSPIEKFNCFHALGHGFYSVDSNVKKSLDRCDVANDNNKKGFCYDGVFMAMTFGGDGLGMSPVDVDLSKPCEQFSGLRGSYCYWRAIPIKTFLSEFEMPTSEYLNEISGRVPVENRLVFWNGFGRELDSRFSSDGKLIKGGCDLAGKDYILNCILGATMHMIFYDKGDSSRAMSLCGDVLSGEEKDQCINAVKNSEYPGLNIK